MKMYRLKHWTGPVAVKQFAQKWQEAGAVDVFDGTETVYFDWAGDSERDACVRARAGYERIHGQHLPMSINPMNPLW